MNIIKNIIYILFGCLIQISLAEQPILIGPGVTTLNGLDGSLRLSGDDNIIVEQISSSDINIGFNDNLQRVKNINGLSNNITFNSDSIDISKSGQTINFELNPDYINRVISINGLSNIVTLDSTSIDILESNQVIKLELKPNLINRVISLNGLENEVSIKAGENINIETNENSLVINSISNTEHYVKIAGDKMTGPLTNSANLTIGTRTENSDSGAGSIAQGTNIIASGQFSIAEGTNIVSEGNYAAGYGVDVIVEDDFSYVWNGIFGDDNPYISHGDGTFNINPTNGLKGFFIGETNLQTAITNLAVTVIMNMITNGFVLDGIEYVLAITPTTNSSILYFKVKSGKPEFNKQLSYTSIARTNLTDIINQDLYSDAVGSLTNIYVGANVENIENGTFADCIKLTGITFSVSTKIKDIGESAFENCIQLKEIGIPENIFNIKNYTFNNCIRLETIEFLSENNLTNISMYAFNNCKNLAHIKLPNTIKYIGTNAFSECGLTEIIFPDELLKIQSHAFAGNTSLTNIVFNDKLQTIESRAFSNCTHLVNLVCPENTPLRETGIMSFRSCVRLTNAILPNIVTLGGYTFRGCTNLATVYLGTNLVTLSGSAFQGCRNLQEIELPATLTTIGNNVFGRCRSLTNIIVSQDNENFVVENGILMTKTGNERIVYAGINNSDIISNLIFPNTVIRIYANSFSERTAIKTVTLPNTITQIGDNAFTYCPSIWKFTVEEGNPIYSSQNNMLLRVFDTYETNIIPEINAEPISAVVTNWELYSGIASTSTSHIIEIPSTVVTIYSNAFTDRNTRLLKIPETVTNIAPNAFDECSYIRFDVDENNNYYFSNESSLLFKNDSEYQTNSIGEIIFTNYFSTLIRGSTIDNPVFPETLEKINNGAWNYNSSLTSIQIPNTVKSMSGSVFENCANLTNVVLSENPKYTYLAGSTFWGCRNLPFLKIPDNITNIGSYAFHNCISLTNISVPASWGTNRDIFIGTDLPDNCIITPRDR